MDLERSVGLDKLVDNAGEVAELLVFSRFLVLHRSTKRKGLLQKRDGLRERKCIKSSAAPTYQRARSASGLGQSFTLVGISLIFLLVGYNANRKRTDGVLAIIVKGKQIKFFIVFIFVFRELDFFRVQPEPLGILIAHDTILYCCPCTTFFEKPKRLERWTRKQTTMAAALMYIVDNRQV